MKVGTITWSISWKTSTKLILVIKEFQKEQGDTEVIVLDASFRRKVKAGPKKKLLKTQEQLKSVTLTYNNNKNENKFNCLYNNKKKNK